MTMTALPPELGVEDETTPRRSRRSLTVLCILTVAVLASVAWAGLGLLERRQQDDLRQEAVSLAEEQALALLSLSAADVEDTLDELLGASTGEFRRQLEGIRESFAGVVRKGEVASEGHVVSSAVKEVDDQSARILLALSAQVTNSETTSPEMRDYRISVDLTRKDDRWLVSGMQFVP